MSDWTKRARELIEAQQLLFYDVKPKEGEAARKRAKKPPPAAKMDRSAGWKYSSIGNLKQAIEKAKKKALADLGVPVKRVISESMSTTWMSRITNRLGGTTSTLTARCRSAPCGTSL